MILLYFKISKIVVSEKYLEMQGCASSYRPNAASREGKEGGVLVTHLIGENNIYNELC